MNQNISDSPIYRRWVVGFLFKDDGREVALVTKNHPKWQAGKLNGVGGKIEQGELPALAMQREFIEEAGRDIADWREFALLKVRDGQVHMFVAHGDYPLQSMTDEPVAWYKTTEVPDLPIIANLAWLVPLALDQGNHHTVIDYFQAGAVNGHQ